MKRLIILVHGTFAPNAPWTQPGSSFRQSLEKQLGKGNIIFDTPQWDGRNNHKSRIAAAKRLAETIDTLIVKNQGCRPVIVAHSHGGNIALYALKLLKWKGSIDIITMATPFLNASIRKYADNFEFHVLFIPITLGFALLMGSGYLFKPATDFAMNLFHLKGFSLVSGLIYLGYLVLVIKIIELFGTWLYHRLQSFEANLPDHITRITENIIFDKPQKNQQILAVIDRNDEIKLWFGGLYRIGEVILSIHELLIKIFRIAGLASFFGAMVLLVIYLINNYIHFTGYNYLEKNFLNGCTYVFMFGMAVTLSSFLIPLLLYTIRSNPVVYGWESIVQQMFVKTTPTIAPIGFTNISLTLYNTTKKHTLALRHALYDDEQVVDDICYWIISAPKMDSREG